MFVGALIFSGCSSSKSGQLEGRWNMTAYADMFGSSLTLTEVPRGEKYTLQLHNTGIFSFTTDCNTISGEYSVDGQKFKFINPAATEMACDKEIMERNIQTLLPLVERYEMPDDSNLHLIGSQDNVIVEFAKLKNWER